jgi:hypothetical protein
MRAIDFILENEHLTEVRNAALQYIKRLLPSWPDYIIYDWIYKMNKTPNPDNIKLMLNDEGLSPNTQWKLISNMKFNMKMWDPWTINMLTQRAGGKSNPMEVPNDAERHTTQAILAKQQGGIRREPVIIIKKHDGYELIEGWHRTIQHFNLYPDGYVGPAWVAISTK